MTLIYTLHVSVSSLSLHIGLSSLRILCTHQSHISCNTFFIFSHLLSTLFKLKNNRIGQPKEHTATIDRDGTSLASSSSFFAQDEHQNAAQDSPSIVKGVVSSSASSYNDLFDTGILSKIRSRSAKSASTSKQQYYKTHAARMRLLASLVKQSDSPSTTFADVGSMPRLDFSSEKLSHMSRKSSMDSISKDTSAKSTKLSAKSSKTTKASTSRLTMEMRLQQQLSVRTLTLKKHLLLRFKSFCLEGNCNCKKMQAFLKKPWVYEAYFLQELQSNAPTGTTVLSVVITSIILTIWAPRLEMHQEGSVRIRQQQFSSFAF